MDSSSERFGEDGGGFGWSRGEQTDILQRSAFIEAVLAYGLKVLRECDACQFHTVVEHATAQFLQCFRQSDFFQTVATAEGIAHDAGHPFGYGHLAQVGVEEATLRDGRKSVWHVDACQAFAITVCGTH